MENSSDLRAYGAGRRQHPPLPQPDAARENCNTIQFRCLKRVRERERERGGDGSSLGQLDYRQIARRLCMSRTLTHPHTHMLGKLILLYTTFMSTLIASLFSHPHPSPPQLAKILTRKLFKCFVLSGLMNSSPRHCLG